MVFQALYVSTRRLKNSILTLLSTDPNNPKIVNAIWPGLPSCQVSFHLLFSHPNLSGNSSEGRKGSYFDDLDTKNVCSVDVFWISSFMQC